MMSVLCYDMHISLVRVEMGNRNGKRRRKVQMFADEQVEGLRSCLAQNITVQGIPEKSSLADAVEAGLAKAGLSRPEKAEPDGW